MELNQRHLLFLLSLILCVLRSEARGIPKTCQTTGCRLSLNNCYLGKCPFDSFVLNRDFFTFFFRKEFSQIQTEDSRLSRDIKYLERKDQRRFNFMQRELREITDSQEELQERILTNSNGDVFRIKIKTSFEQITRIKREVFIELIERGNSPGNLSSSELVNILKQGFSRDSGALGEYLQMFPDDDIRGAILYPVACAALCQKNYEGLYSVWFKLMRRLKRYWSTYVKRVDRCDQRKFRMASRFKVLSLKYPDYIRKKLKDYFKYLVLNRICVMDWT